MGQLGSLIDEDLVSNDKGMSQEARRHNTASSQTYTEKVGLFQTYLQLICDQMHSCILHNVSKQMAYHAYDRDILHEIFSVCAPLAF